VVKAAGLAVLAVGAWVVADKWAAGTLPELLWACHVATALLGGSLVVGWWRGVDAAGALLVGVGLPGWLLEVAVNGPGRASSAMEHLLGPAIAAWVWWGRGPGPTTARDALGLWLLTALVARIATDPVHDVNLVFRPFAGWPEGTPNLVAFSATTALAGALLAGVVRGVEFARGRD
jgi:hypothetical protein